jgi:hypothetical protein
MSEVICPAMRASSMLAMSRGMPGMRKSAR